MWQRHWNLTHDPFDDRRSTFVATPTHDEAVARVVHTIESAGRSARLVAGAGLGKSIVLARALEATRSLDRRVARAARPIDGVALFATLAIGLGARVAPDASRPVAWRALVDSARVCRWQGLHVVLAVDDCQALDSTADRLDLARLDHLDPDPSARLTVLRFGRPPEPHLDPHFPSDDWGLAVRLGPLSRSEAASYLGSKLESAGRADPTFTPRALTRLHALSGGNPRGLDRLAALGLMAAADRGLEIVPPDIVDDSARECLAIEAGAWGA